MKKRVVSILAAVTTAASCSSICASASAESSLFAEKFKDCIKIEGDSSALLGRNYEAVYMESLKNHGAAFYFVEKYPDQITFSVSKEIDENLLEQIIKNVDENLILSCWKHTTTEDYNCTVTLKNDEDKYDVIDSNTAKKLYKALSEYAKSFDYSYNRQQYGYDVIGYMTGYESMDHSFPLEEKLDEYLESHDVNASLVKYSKGDTDIFGKNISRETFYIIPDNDITDMEHYELAKSIAEETGIRPHGESPTGLGADLEGNRVDLTKYLDGDANCDSDRDMADVVTIMQSLANPNKYQLSDMGSFNADMDGNGVTVGDAQKMQRILLGLDKA